MAILLMFNDKLKFDLNDMCSRLETSKQNAIPHIQSLIKAQLLIAVDSINGESLNDFDSERANVLIELNQKFQK